MYLARHLHDLGRRDVTAIFGATTHDLLPVLLISEPARDGTPTHCAHLPAEAHFAATITTDDGSLGLKGVVTDALGLWHRSRGGNSAGAVVFACGPDAMLRALARQTRELGLRCQLSIERMMGCGLGACQACITRLCDPSRPDGWRWALTCSDGPVFDRDALFDY
jgi:dihydroorotate dehydrogenase electron transfer subunit